MTGMFSSIRYAVRAFRRNPLFTAVAVVSLALGIGANTAVFTLLDQLVLRLLPVKEPQRLVMIWPTGPAMGGEDGERASSYPMCEEFQRRAGAFDFVFCRYDQQVAVGFHGGTERADSELVSGNYFQALGVRPALGRVFSPEADDRIYKGHPSVVLSYRYWVSRFAGDPKIVGQKILVNQYPMEVVGVAPPGFTGLDPAASPQLWVPIQMEPLMIPGQDALGDRREHWVQIFARLKPGYTVKSARASLQPLFHQILEREAQEPALRQISKYDRLRFLRRTIEVETAATGYSEMRERYSTALVVLMSMAGLILLVACSNVASLLIARRVARQREIAVRLAMGASRKTLMAHLLVESMLLSLAGAGLGVLLAGWATRGLLAMLPGGGTTLLLRAEPDLRILMFSVAVALATGVLFGLAPAVTATKLDLFAALKEAAGAVVGSGGSARLRKALVTAQVALSFLLLAGAGLFTRTLINLKNTPTGFRSIGELVTFQVDAGKLGYPAPRVRQFYGDLLGDIRGIPGVRSAGYAVVPVLQNDFWGWPISVEGHQAKDGENMQAHVNIISPGYFRTMGARILAGRDFNEQDRFNDSNVKEMPSVAIVNRAFAEHFFGKTDCVGRRIGSGSESDKLTIRIVGVVENSLYEGPRAGVPRQVFYAHFQAPVPLRAYFYVRMSGSAAAIFPVLRRTVARLDPSMPVDDMKTLAAQLDESLSTERLIAALSVVFGVLATVLAALGVYGVMAFVVMRRTREIGLRMALGAARSEVLWLVLREVLTLVGAGLAAGVPAALLLSRYVASQLFGVTPTDVWTCAAATAVLGFVGAVSAFVPARRAGAIDPVTALRYE